MLAWVDATGSTFEGLLSTQIFMRFSTQSRTYVTLIETVSALIRIGCILGVYWLAIFIATHLPSQSMPVVASDKLAHLVAFSGLGFLLTWAVSRTGRSVRWQAFRVLTIALVYASIDEWSQRFVAGRQPDLEDVLADVLGAGVGLIGFYLIRSLYRTICQRQPEIGEKSMTRPVAKRAAPTS